MGTFFVRIGTADCESAAWSFWLSVCDGCKQPGSTRIPSMSVIKRETQAGTACLSCDCRVDSIHSCCTTEDSYSERDAEKTNISICAYFIFHRNAEVELI